MDYTILVSDIMDGKSFPDAGDSLYSILAGNLDKDRIVLDMRGITVIPSLFLNTSLGRLMNEQGVGLVRQKIAFRNIPVSQMKHIREYVRRYES